jgi:parallel beta-helix repeat protein
LAVLVMLGLVAACQPILIPPASTSELIGCARADERVQVTKTSHLDRSCVYTLGFDVTASNVTLDCQGATIRSTVANGWGIRIVTPIDTPLTGVKVRNCHVEGFLNSLRVTRDGFRTLPQGIEYENGTSNILVENSTFRGSRGVGIFVDGYVEGVTIRGNQVIGAGSSGIYLETGSRDSHVEGNVLLDNGFIENGPNGQPYDFNGVDLWVWGTGREGISVDGSYDNTIVRNVFKGNSAGGVFLYKNCGEFPDRARYFERRYPSENNLIEGNYFFGGIDGVWVGSRMAENTFPMECTDPAYIDEPLRRVVLDRANDNIVRRNVFTDVTYGIRVEDDGNVVDGNIFAGSGPQLHPVIVGTPLRTAVLDRPVARTTLINNVSNIAGLADPYRWIAGHVDTVDEGNLSNGEPAELCPGVDPPRLAFIFTIAIAPQAPGGGPPATTPDLTRAVLGPLPNCHGTE